MASYATPAELDCARREKQSDSINTTTCRYSSNMMLRISILSVLSSGVKLMKPVHLNKLKAEKKSSNFLFYSSWLVDSRGWSPESGVRCLVAVGRWCVWSEIPTLSYIAQIPPAWWQRPAAAEWERRPQTVNRLQWHHLASGTTFKIKHVKEHAGFEYCELPK